MNQFQQQNIEQTLLFCVISSHIEQFMPGRILFSMPACGTHELETY